MINFIKPCSLTFMILAMLFSQACVDTKTAINSPNKPDSPTETTKTKTEITKPQLPSSTTKPKTPEEQFLFDIEQGAQEKVLNAIKEIKLLDKDLGVIALTKATDEKIKKIVAKKMYISLRRSEVADEQLLADLAYVSQSFKTLRSLGVNLDMVAKPAYGIIKENERGPLLVMLTSLDKPGKVMMKIAEALIEAGANVNAVDNLGHTALHYADTISRTGYDYQKQPFIELANYLRTKGGQSR
jgi:hypothetical protein